MIADEDEALKQHVEDALRAAFQISLRNVVAAEREKGRTLPSKSKAFAASLLLLGFVVDQISRETSKEIAQDALIMLAAAASETEVVQ